MTAIEGQTSLGSTIVPHSLTGAIMGAFNRKTVKEAAVASALKFLIAAGAQYYVAGPDGKVFTNVKAPKAGKVGSETHGISIKATRSKRTPWSELTRYADKVDAMKVGGEVTFRAKDFPNVKWSANKWHAFSTTVKRYAGRQFGADNVASTIITKSADRHITLLRVG